MIRKLLTRWASRTLQKRVRDLESQLEAERRRLAVANAEIETLAAVVVRDRSRIQAETAAYQRAKAEHEGTTRERDYEGTGRR